MSWWPPVSLNSPGTPRRRDLVPLTRHVPSAGTLWPGLAWPGRLMLSGSQLCLELCVLVTLWVQLPDASENRSQQYLHQASHSEQPGWCCRNLWKEAYNGRREHQETLDHLETRLRDDGKEG